jgi:hypothetical protein
MANPYGITLNRAWTEWAAEQGMSEAVAAALYLIFMNMKTEEVVAKLKPSEVELVVDTVQHWPDRFPRRAFAALNESRLAPSPEPSTRYDRATHASRPTRPSAAPQAATKCAAELSAQTDDRPCGRQTPQLVWL